MMGEPTASGFLLARSIDTAPPMDCPYRIWRGLSTIQPRQNQEPPTIGVLE